MGGAMSLVLQSTSGGSVTINEPTTASNFTATMPAATGTILTSASTGVCVAWVNFNGTSGSTSVRASYNVSSVTRVSTGSYTVTFTNNLVDTNYAVVTGLTTPAWSTVTHAYSYTTSSFRYEAGSGTVPTYQDVSVGTAAVFR